MVTINETQVKKDLYKSKAMARFSHYKEGNLYYHVDLEDGTYEFPIPTIETKSEQIEDGLSFSLILSEDLGATSFYAEIRGSELARWISKAINAFQGCKFIKVG